MRKIVNSKVALIVVLALFFTTQYGCGTLFNVGNPVGKPKQGNQYLYDDGGGLAHVKVYPYSVNDKVIFGGVFNDVMMFTEPAYIPLGIFVLADLPLSVAGDTITLPFTVYWTLTVEESDLIHAVRDGDVEEVKRLIKEGADVNQRSPAGRTLIRIAMTDRYRAVGHDVENREVVKVILRNGADISEKSLRLAYMWPRFFKRQDSMELSEKREEMIRLFVKQSVINNQYDGDRGLLLVISCNFGYTKYVKKLVKEGVDVNARDMKDGGKTGLMLASRYGYKGIVKFLLKNGVDPSLETDKGKTALDFARENGQNEVVQLLKKHMTE